MLGVQGNNTSCFVEWIPNSLEAAFGLQQNITICYLVEWIPNNIKCCVNAIGLELWMTENAITGTIGSCKLGVYCLFCHLEHKVTWRIIHLRSNSSLLSDNGRFSAVLSAGGPACPGGTNLCSTSRSHSAGPSAIPSACHSQLHGTSTSDSGIRTQYRRSCTHDETHGCKFSRR